MAREDLATTAMHRPYGPYYGRWFGRPHWTRK
jgi:hypothetical protein